MVLKEIDFDGVEREARLIRIAEDYRDVLTKWGFDVTVNMERYDIHLIVRGPRRGGCRIKIEDFLVRGELQK